MEYVEYHGLHRFCLSYCFVCRSRRLASAEFLKDLWSDVMFSVIPPSHFWELQQKASYIYVISGLTCRLSVIPVRMIPCTFVRFPTAFLLTHPALLLSLCVSFRTLLFLALAPSAQTHAYNICSMFFLYFRFDIITRKARRVEWAAFSCKSMEHEHYSCVISTEGALSHFPQSNDVWYFSHFAVCGLFWVCGLEKFFF